MHGVSTQCVCVRALYAEPGPCDSGCACAGCAPTAPASTLPQLCCSSSSRSCMAAQRHTSHHPHQHPYTVPTLLPPAPRPTHLPLLMPRHLLQRVHDGIHARQQVLAQPWALQRARHLPVQGSCEPVKSRTTLHSCACGNRSSACTSSMLGTVHLVLHLMAGTASYQPYLPMMNGAVVHQGKVARGVGARKLQALEGVAHCLQCAIDQRLALRGRGVCMSVQLCITCHDSPGLLSSRLLSSEVTAHFCRIKKRGKTCVKAGPTP